MNAVGALVAGRGHGRSWPRPRPLVFAAVLGLAVASCGGSGRPAASGSPANSLTVRSCTVDDEAARCGTLIVPEDRLTGQGRTIPVRFVVFPATGGDRLPDPLVFFAGGPGDSAITASSTWLPVLQSLSLHRDLVFIEQRGTGQSNPMNCPAFPATLADKAALRASVESCLTRLPGDLRFYTTAMFTDDVSQILTDLHYATANLIGGSYGPTAEQVFLLRHPGQVRTMTMLNASLLSVPMFQQEPGNAQLGLDHVFALCQRQPGCQQAFPHLGAEWAALWSSLGKSPWVLPAAQSPTAKTERVDQGTVAGWIYQALHASEIAPIPVIVHTLGTAANKAAALVSVIKALQAAGLSGSGGGATPMMQYEIVCAEPWASRQFAPTPDQRDSFYYQTDLDTAKWYQYVCPLLPRSAAAVGSQQLTASQVPVLAFNGGADPNDQPRNMAAARQFWPDSLVLTLPGQGHYFSSANGWDCESALIRVFVQRASTAHLDTSCVANTPAPAFPRTLRELAGSA